MSGVVEIKGLPAHVIDEMHKIVVAPGAALQPLPMKWPDMQPSEQKIVAQLRTERKRLRSAMDNAKRFGKCEISTAYGVLLRKLSAWANAYHEKIAATILESMDGMVDDGVALIKAGVQKVQDAKVMAHKLHPQEQGRESAPMDKEGET
eukprot:4208885-Karenia_brevis.AAC.1